MKNDESLRKNVFAEMKKNILERISDSPDQMEQKIRNTEVQEVQQMILNC